MVDLVFWLWAPALLVIIAIVGLALTRRDHLHPGE
jgi:hypothetical protein